MSDDARLKAVMNVVSRVRNTHPYASGHAIADAVVRALDAYDAAHRGPGLEAVTTEEWVRWTVVHDRHRAGTYQSAKEATDDLLARRRAASEPVVTDAAVDAGAKELWEYGGWGSPFADLSETVKTRQLTIARACLEAAAPFMRADVSDSRITTDVLRDSSQHSLPTDLAALADEAAAEARQYCRPAQEAYFRAVAAEHRRLRDADRAVVDAIKSTGWTGPLARALAARHGGGGR
jgi:hypothetical protein